MEITFLTGNLKKLEEIRTILGKDFDVKNIELDIKEIQDIDGLQVAVKKAKDAFRLVQKPIIVEDTSLYIKAWHNLPGAFNKWFMKTVGNEGMLKMLESYEDRSAVAQTVIAYNDGKGVRTFEGMVKGKISKEIKGENGFGWDKIFIPDGQDKTFAEVSSEEKNSKSARKIAAEGLRGFLVKQNG